VDNVQVYNLPKFDGYHERAQPPVLRDHIKEIEKFSRKCHSEVVVKLLRLFAIILELPDEDQLVKDHEYDVKGEDHLRYMHYAARSPELNAQVGELYSPGHTDLGSITLLFRQPVAALQILNSEQQWKWVKPQDETITINICDALQALTGNFLKSSIHRVHTPPDDQAHIDRLGVLFFARYVDIADTESQYGLVTTPANTPLQTQQPRCPRPNLQQPAAESSWTERQRLDQTWATSDNGTVGQSTPVATTAPHEGTQDRWSEVSVRR
jgi:isopenicillin N synthase-like dioxygenase